MAWYARNIDTADVSDSEETETDRMWRQIDPRLHDALKRAMD